MLSSRLLVRRYDDDDGNDDDDDDDDDDNYEPGPPVATRGVPRMGRVSPMVPWCTLG